MEENQVINHLSDTKKELNIEAPVELVQQEFDKAYATLGRSAKVAGFRPGKAPRAIIKQKFQNEAREMVTEELVPRLIGEALREHGLNPIGNPTIDEFSLQEGQDLRIKATVEVLPSIEVAEYKGLSVKKRVASVTPKEIDEALEGLREQHGQLVPVEDRPAESSDIASVLVSAKPVSSDEVPTTGLYHAVELEIDGEDVMPEFSENLKGMSLGETRSFRVTYPADYPSEEFAGKEFEYELKLQAIHRKEVPDLDDEFPKTIGEETATLADFRQELERRLEKEHEDRADEALNGTVLNRLVEAHAFEVPESFVQQRLEMRMRTMAQSMAARGINPQTADIDWDAVIRRQREISIRDVRGGLLLRRIADLESIDVSDTDVDQEIARLAPMMRESTTQLRGRLTKEGALDSMKNEIKNRKALELIVKAAAVEREVVDGETEAGPGEQESATEQPDSPDQI